MEKDSTAIGSLRLQAAQGERMQTPEEVAAMLRLHDLGWGSRRIAAQLGCSRTTVKRYVAAAGCARLAEISARVQRTHP